MLPASSAAVCKVVPGPGREVGVDMTATAIMIADLLRGGEGVCLSLMTCFHAHTLMLENVGRQEVWGASETKHVTHSRAQSRASRADRCRRSVLQKAFPWSLQT